MANENCKRVGDPDGVNPLLRRLRKLEAGSDISTSRSHISTLRPPSDCHQLIAGKQSQMTSAVVYPEFREPPPNCYSVNDVSNLRRVIYVKI